MNERQLRAYKRRNAQRQGDVIANVIIAAVVLLLGYFSINAVLNAVDHRVCNTSSPQQYINLHCDEVR